MMSPPAQNAFPAPVRTTARTAGSAATAATAAAISRLRVMFSALSAEGRFKVKVATPPSRPTVSVWKVEPSCSRVWLTG